MKCLAQSIHGYPIHVVVNRSKSREEKHVYAYTAILNINLPLSILDELPGTRGIYHVLKLDL